MWVAETQPLKPSPAVSQVRTGRKLDGAARPKANLGPLVRDVGIASGVQAPEADAHPSRGTKASAVELNTLRIALELLMDSPSGSGEAQVAAMSEAYFPVESGALGAEENFLSLDDILMSHEKLPVRTEIPMPRLGVFFQDRSTGAESDHAIPQGSKLELPLWLAKGLFDNKRRVLSAELPKLYQQGWRTVFSADANVVDLHKMGPHFYGFGSQLLHFDSPENADISQCLLQTFIGRFRRIMDSSQNAYNEDTSTLVARLDELERGLFQTGQKGLNDFQCWEKGQASQITASSLVQNYKKRKFTDMES